MKKNTCEGSAAALPSLRRLDAFLRSDRLERALLPLSLTASSLLLFCFYYLGLAFEDNSARQYGFLFCSLLLAGVIFLVFARFVRNGGLRGLSRLGRLPLGAVVAVYMTLYAAGFLRHSQKDILLEYFEKFLIFCLPAFCAGIIAARRGLAADCFAFLEKLSFLALPAAVIYLNGFVFGCNPFNSGVDLGILSYMTVAYTLMPFLMAHLLRLFDGEPLTVPVLHYTFRHPRLVRGLLIALYWACIVASGTRGTYVCVVIFCALWALQGLLCRDHGRGRCLVAALLLGFLMFNLCVTPLPGMDRASRIDVFLAGLEEGRLTTSSKEDPSISADLNALVQEDSPQQSTDLPEEDSPQIYDRGTLFKLAVLEFLNAPLTGMGPGGYTIKYGRYPHNAPLELLCETGLVGTLPMLALILAAIWKLLRAQRQDRGARMMLLLLSAFAVKSCISGCLWQCTELLCGLGYGLALPNARSRAAQTEPPAAN